MRPNTNVGKKEVVCFCCEIIVVTLAANHATLNSTALLYGGGLEEKPFCINNSNIYIRGFLEHEWCQL